MRERGEMISARVVVVGGRARPAPPQQDVGVRVVEVGVGVTGAEWTVQLGGRSICRRAVMLTEPTRTHRERLALALALA
eukprot:CAMPEP_0182530120 /NCGR_PEP_ID=MMETSP1323-20130603/5683_1 /TAXON_ID=236787 /ORGANISM="Florenciella parvula, Strain RCC1693" /LENGTH=78 /DNA_ID=CAMNT_0024739387 /DNA_START=1 /DNA_END=234 /DNA_ORIENTATION=-